MIHVLITIIIAINHYAATAAKETRQAGQGDGGVLQADQNRSGVSAARVQRRFDDRRNAGGDVDAGGTGDDTSHVGNPCGFDSFFLGIPSG